MEFIYAALLVAAFVWPLIYAHRVGARNKSVFCLEIYLAAVGIHLVVVAIATLLWLLLVRYGGPFCDQFTVAGQECPIHSLFEVSMFLEQWGVAMLVIIFPLLTSVLAAPIYRRHSLYWPKRENG